jgi:hypothetical protein
MYNLTVKPKRSTAVVIAYFKISDKKACELSKEWTEKGFDTEIEETRKTDSRIRDRKGFDLY